MLIFNSKETVRNILIKIWCYKFNKDLELLVNWINISLIEILNEKPNKSELWLFKFWNNPVSFISFKEKIKYSLMNWIKIHFKHLPDNNIWIENWINIINDIIEWWWRIIIQLPINNNKLLERIDNFNEFEDIDNLKKDTNRYWCTQSAILGLSQYIINREWVNNIIVIWSEWFIWSGVIKWLNESFQDINIMGIDLNNKLSESEINYLFENTDLIISNSSNIIKIPKNIKKWVSIIDCWFIRWKLWIR